MHTKSAQKQASNVTFSRIEALDIPGWEWNTAAGTDALGNRMPMFIT